MNRLPARMKRITLLVLTFLVSTVFSRGSDNLMDAQPESDLVKRSPKDKCGLRPYDSRQPNHNRIIQGEQASYGEFPWQISIDIVLKGPGGSAIRMRGAAASIINEFWLLSAAHMFEYQPKDYEVTAGNHDRSLPDEFEQVFRVDTIIKHEQFKGHSNGYDYDIALIKITKSAKGRGFQFNSYVQPVCLPDSTTSYKEGNTCIVSGWGITKSLFYDLMPRGLMKTKLKLVDRKKCQQMGHLLPITDRMLCAGDLQGHTGTCFGDSGSGLVYKDRGAYTVLGVVSWGPPNCNEPNKPGVFTDVLHLLPWIKSTMTSHSDSDEERMLPARP